MKVSQSNKLFKKFGRAGLSERILELISTFETTKTYKEAIILAGRLHQIADVALRDGYWGEKVVYGMQLEKEYLESHHALITKDADGLIKQVIFGRDEEEELYESRH